MRKLLKEEFLVVEEAEAGIRLDRFVTQRLTDYTRSHIQKLADAGEISLQGVPCKASYKVKAGDQITLRIPELKEPDILPEEIPLSIVFEDEDMLVVNKPQGMVVHPAAGNYTGTLVHALLAHCGDSLSGINGEKRPGILHRIDKDTSGLLLVAKNDVAHQHLATQIKEHSLTRAYQALVHGRFKTEKGEINLPIGRHPQNRKKMAVTYRNSREAVTRFHVLESLGAYTLVECALKTGRTHQIRVHMSHLGHPVVGDPVYGVKKERFPTNGQLLHAYKVGFVHPRSGEYLEFESPLPEHYKKILEIIRNL